MHRRTRLSPWNAYLPGWRVRDDLLLAGADPASWPNAALAMRGPELDECHQPELTGPDAHAELDGIGARAERYRTELANDRCA